MIRLNTFMKYLDQGSKVDLNGYTFVMNEEGDVGIYGVSPVRGELCLVTDLSLNYFNTELKKMTSEQWGKFCVQHTNTNINFRGLDNIGSRVE